MHSLPMRKNAVKGFGALHKVARPRIGRSDTTQAVVRVGSTRACGTKQRHEKASYVEG